MDHSGDKPKYKNRYVVEKFLGRGSQAQVYLITDTHQNNLKALKMVQLCPPYDYSRISTEPNLVTQLNHQNIIKAYEYYIEEKANRYDKTKITKYVYIILQYVEGGDLNKFLGKLSIEDIKKIYRQIRNGLLYLHSKCIVHRDIALKNILLDKNKNAKIIDFGISNELKPNQTTFTTIGCGTEYYKPPELFSKLKIKTVKSDLWALGIVILELILGKNIYQVQRYQEMIPGREQNFPQIIFKNEKIPSIFLPVLKSLLARQYEKRELIDIQNEIIKECKFEDMNKELLFKEYLIEKDNVIYKNEQGIIIYRGFSKTYKIEVAIKIIDIKSNEQKNKIITSNQLILNNQFSHVNLLRIIDLKQIDNKIYIISEYCQHKNLYEYMKIKKLNQYEIVQFIDQTVTSLAQFNKNGFIHRNINLKNIYIKSNGQSRIAGFDKIIENSGETAQQLYPYDFPNYKKQQLAYIAPNLLKKQWYSGLCDVWSLGCVIYQILYRKKLFENFQIGQLQKQQEQVLKKVIQSQQDNYHPQFKILLLMMLGYDQNNRNSFIEIQRYLNRNKSNILIQLQNSTKIKKIFKYIDFLYRRAFLMIECAELIQGFYNYIQNFHKNILIYLLYGRYLHAIDQISNILNHKIINLPNKQNINIKNFDAKSKKKYQEQLKNYQNKFIYQNHKYLQQLVLISKEIFRKSNKYREIYKEYQQLFNILDIIVTTNSLKQSYSFFNYNYKLFLFNQCKLKKLQQQISQDQIRVYHFCLKLVNINNTLNEQNYMDQNIVEDFLKNMEQAKINEIIENIKNIHKNVQGEY